MEMCYDGALVMPSNYVEMHEDEMIYTDGGWSSTVFANNIRGAIRKFSEVSRIIRISSGLGVGYYAKLCAMSAKSIITVYGATISKAAWIVGGVVAGIIATAAISTGIYYLGNNRCWY